MAAIQRRWIWPRPLSNARAVIEAPTPPHAFEQTPDMHMIGAPHLCLGRATQEIAQQADGLGDVAVDQLALGHGLNRLLVQRINLVQLRGQELDSIDIALAARVMEGP